MAETTIDGTHRLVAALSLEDKVRLLTGKTTWRTWSLPTIGLREIVMSDGPVGVRGTGETPDETSECLPSPTALAACWDPDLAEEVGAWLATQARAHGVDVVLAPVVNLQRSPVGGRHFECLSEDPSLIADVAVALITGVQQGGVAACVKHFVGNEVETDRTRYVSRIDERTLREVYLAPFQRVVAAGVWSVMAAYNRVGALGETAPAVAHHRLLTEILKGEWGFEGPVISDWTAVQSTVPPALGGLDLAMPGPHSPWSSGALLAAVRSGDVPESVIDDKVRRLLWLADRVGGLDHQAGDPQVRRADGAALRCDTPADSDPQSSALPRRVAAEGTVVLTNRDDVLPVRDPDSIRTIALIGPNAADPRLLGGGSASVAIAHPVSYAEGMALGFPRATITVVPGVTTMRGTPPLDMADTWAGLAPDRDQSGASSLGVRVEFVGRDTEVLKQAVYDTWTGTFDDAIPDGTITVHLATTVHLTTPGVHRLEVGTVGRHRILIDGREVSTSPYDVGGEVVIDSSFNVPPAHGLDLTVTDPRDVGVEAWVQVIPTQWGAKARASLGHRLPGPDESATIEAACRAAESADLAIVIVGTNEETESEGWDRATLDLPGRQDELVRAVLAVRPDVLVLVNAGAPCVLPWLDQARTVLWGWFGGQDAGGALADILTGVTEPAGRLPWTLPGALEHCPVPRGLPNVNGIIEYTEGVHVGYRGWLRAGHTPARPFGYGLGWTTWQYDQVRLTAHTPTGVEVTVRVTNTGVRTGAAVVQAYLSAPASAPDTDDRPIRWLAGHARATVAAGLSADLTLAIPRAAFATWRTGITPGWVVPAGSYTLAVGPNVLDLPVSVEVTWT